ncbi:MAG TPA: DUF6600 domain-containing protein [Terriglobales bacterium]|nr:DUF6600 domain-containing protein [Terriglobales bacterium]
MKNLGRWGTEILATLVILSAAAFAGDPPGRVARLQYMSGEVSLQPGGVNDWVGGVINRPLTTADRVWADKNSRAELQLGNSAVRVSSETSITLTNVSDGTVQVELDQGVLNLWVRHLYRGEIYEVDTPNLAFTVMKAGEYRFDVDSNGDTTLVTVWRGEGEATGQGRAVRVKHDHTARFTEGTSLAHETYEAKRLDGFDDWCQIRDRREQYSQSAHYVSPDVIGAEDLDDYGTWRVVPDYGAMWVPAVAPGWAPYHYGHWAWVEPWGWTWIDDAPWGFAPCHYGRWVYYSGYWGWVPGPVAVQPVYAPALVAWVGGSNFGISFGFGTAPAVGWFPLGYGEPYLPPYRVSPGYFRNVNVSNTHITNITNVTNNYYNTTNINSNNVNSNNTTTITKNNTTIVANNTTNITKNTTNVTDNSININGNHNNVHINYANQKVPGAVTAVPSSVLTNSQPVAKSAVHVPESELKETAFMNAPPVAPSHNSVLGSKAGEQAVVPPAQAESRKVVVKQAAPPKPVPFYIKEQELTKNPGRPVDSKVEDELRMRVQNQPTGRREEQEAKQPPQANRAEPKVVANPEMRPAQTPVPVATPVHSVPRPAVNTGEEKMPPAAERSHAAEEGERTNAETAHPAEHMVPRPPERGRSEQPAASVPARAVVNPQERPAGQAPQSQVRIVPRPPERLQIEKPNAGASAEKAVNEPSNGKASNSAEAPRPQERAVPRPPEHGNPSQPSYEPVSSSPRAEPRLIPAPPSNNADKGREMPRHDPVQARPQESQPSAPRPESRPERETSPAPVNYPGGGAGARPSYEPRTEHPAREAAPASGGSEVRPSASRPAAAPARSEKEEPGKH